MALQGLLALAGGSWNAAMPRLSSPCRSDCRLPAPCRTAVCMKERAVVIGGNGEADEEDTLDIMDVGASGMNRVDVGQEDWLFFDRARIRVTAGDGGDGCVGFIVDFNKECFDQEKVKVYWPLSPSPEVDKRRFHRASSGSAELEFAPYRCSY